MWAVKVQSHTQCTLHASGLLLAALAIPAILGLSKCDAVEVPGTTPFYLEARFLKQHDGWAQYWDNFFNNKPNENGDALKDKDLRRRLFGMLSIENVTGTKETVMRKITTPWTRKHELVKGGAS